MRPRPAARSAAALILIAALAAPAPGQVRAKRRELQRIQKELESTRRDIEEYRALEKTLGRELDRIESRSQAALRRMRELQGRLESARERRKELQGRLAAVGQASGLWRESLDSDMRLYAQAFASESPAYGGSDLWARALRRAAILEKARLLLGLRGLGQKTEAAEADTRRRAEDLLRKSRVAEADRLSSRLEAGEKKAAIARAQERKAEAVAKARELEETAAALTRLIESLSRRERPPSPGQAGRLDVPRHSLPWPAEGSVARPFGRHRNPEIDAWVISQGVLLKTRPETAVGAVDDGRVIFSGPFRSYGQVLILDHGSNFFSIYGELGAILKDKGARVRAGQAIGRSSQKGGLYLELRRGTQALDPMEWLKKK